MAGTRTAYLRETARNFFPVQSVPLGSSDDVLAVDHAIAAEGAVASLVSRSASMNVQNYSDMGVFINSYEIEPAWLTGEDATVGGGIGFLIDTAGNHIMTGGIAVSAPDSPLFPSTRFILATTAVGEPIWSFSLSRTGTRWGLDSMSSAGSAGMLISGHHNDGGIEFTTLGGAPQGLGNTIGDGDHGYVARFDTSDGQMLWELSRATSESVFAVEYDTNWVVAVGSLNNDLGSPTTSETLLEAGAGAFYVSLVDQSGSATGVHREATIDLPVGTRSSPGFVEITALTLGDNGVLYVAGTTSSPLTFGDFTTDKRAFIVPIDPMGAITALGR